jgi:hypothetical protein
MRLAALCQFLKVYDPVFSKISRALPGAGQTEAFLSLHLTHSLVPSIMIRRLGEGRSQAPQASQPAQLRKWQAQGPSHQIEKGMVA